MQFFAVCAVQSLNTTVKMMNNIKIGIIVADIDEYKPLAEYIEKGEFKPYSFLGRTGHSFTVATEKGCAKVVSLLCGIGKVNAAAAAAHFADCGCDIILNFGLSGGISGIGKGEMCICDRFLEHDFDLTGIGYKPCEKPSQKYIYDADERLIAIMKELLPDAKCGTAVSGDCFVCDDKLRLSLKESFNAMSCDMETAAIAYVCDFANIPFLALRRISDDAGNDAGDSYREMNVLSEAVLSDLIIEFIKAVIDKNVNA